MVRLQHEKEKGNVVLLPLSQFHYGSITTFNIVAFNFPDFLVSIPLWFDYNN